MAVPSRWCDIIALSGSESSDSPSPSREKVTRRLSAIESSCPAWSSSPPVLPAPRFNPTISNLWIPAHEDCVWIAQHTSSLRVPARSRRRSAGGDTRRNHLTAPPVAASTRDPHARGPKVSLSIPVVNPGRRAEPAALPVASAPGWLAPAPSHSSRARRAPHAPAAPPRSSHTWFAVCAFQFGICCCQLQCASCAARRVQLRRSIPARSAPSTAAAYGGFRSGSSARHPVSEAWRFEATWTSPFLETRPPPAASFSFLPSNLLPTVLITSVIILTSVGLRVIACRRLVSYHE